MILIYFIHVIHHQEDNEGPYQTRKKIKGKLDLCQLGGMMQSPFTTNVKNLNKTTTLCFLKWDDHEGSLTN